MEYSYKRPDIGLASKISSRAHFPALGKGRLTEQAEYTK